LAVTTEVTSLATEHFMCLPVLVCNEFFDWSVYLL